MPLEELETIFINAFPQLDRIGQQQSLTLYRLLAAGQAVAVADFAAAIAYSEQQAQQLLDSWTGVTYESDDKSKTINGFWGLSISETTHRFELNGHTLYTWCAWDLLFMPQLLQQTLDVETRCPVSGKNIQIRVSENGVESVMPATATMTFIKPDIEALKKNVINSFCQFIFFLASDSEAETWLENHPDSFLLTINQGFELGRNIIHSVFSLK